MSRKPIDMFEYSLDQVACRCGIVQGNIIGNGVEIV